jgi:chromosomal replication initiator protein
MVLNSSKTDELWTSILNSIEPEINDKMVFETFFADSKIVDVSSNVFTILVSKFGKNVISSNPSYFALISEKINQITETNYTLKVVDEYVAEEKGTNDFIPISSNLSLNYLFENFVVGPSNSEAYKAALATAVNPSKFYNPLFIYGKPGTGKTHLLNSIGNYIRLKNNAFQSLYCSATEFVDEYFKAAKKDGLEEFKNKFRKIDILLLDDIQFLNGKKGVSEFFFLIFNLLVNNNKQIVISSDRSPLELEKLEERLVSRFASGLTVSVSSPDYYTALKILKKKIETQKIDSNFIDEEVLEHIAKNFSSDIRKLEGALNKLLFTALTFNKSGKITMDDATSSLKLAGLSSEKEILSIDKIKYVVSEYYSISEDLLVGKIRTNQISSARHIAMYLCRTKLNNASLKDIGDAFGGRDHASVIFAVDKVNKLCKEDSTYIEVIKELNERLK